MSDILLDNVDYVTCQYVKVTCSRSCHRYCKSTNLNQMNESSTHLILFGHLQIFYNSNVYGHETVYLNNLVVLNICYVLNL